LKCPAKGYILFKKKGDPGSTFSRKSEWRHRGPLPYSVIIVSSFELTHNSASGFFTIRSTEESVCPYCSGELIYRDSKLRKSEDLTGNISCFLLRRLRCQGNCKTLHTELPDIIQPYKHYESSVIQSVIDGSADASTCHADDSTIRRWKNDFEKAKPDIEQRLASVYGPIIGEIAPIGATRQILEVIKGECKRWLAFVIKLLIKNGHRLYTRFAFCPPKSPDTVRTRSTNDTERGKEDDATIENSS